MKYGQEMKDISPNIIRNSWLIALFLVETLLCKMVALIIPIPNISVIGMVIILLLFLFFNIRYGLKIKIFSLLVFGILLLILITSGLLNGFQYVGNYFAYFLAFGMTAMLLMTVEFDYKTTLVAVLKLSVLYIICYFAFERGSFVLSDNYWASQMGMAYGFLTPTVAGLTVVMKKDVFRLNRLTQLLAWICLLAGIYVICIDCGTRGAMVSVAIAMGMLFIGRAKPIKKIVIVTLLSIAVILILTNLEEVLLFINQWFGTRGISMPALNKMIRMMSLGIEYNGRNELSSLAIDVFKTSPLWGRGVGYYESVFGGYTHNMITELLCEVGVIGLLCAMLPILKNFIGIFIGNQEDSEMKSFNSFLFLITIPILMFSSSYWLLPSFWMYLWFILRGNGLMKRKRIQIG